MKKYITLISMTFILSCVKVAENQESKLVNLSDNLGISGISNLSEIAESVNIVPLETNSNSLLGSPYTYLSFENGILFIKQNINDLKLFDQNGNFMCTFNRHGRGPEEYEHLTSFKIDSKSNNILVSTHSGLIEYDQNANFIKK